MTHRMRVGMDTADVSDHAALLNDESDSLNHSRRRNQAPSLFAKDMLIFTLVTGIGGFLFGYDTGVIAGALPFIRQDMPDVHESVEWQGAVVSGAVGGAVVGSLVAGRLCDKWGRKTSLLLADGVFILGALLMAAAPSPYLLVVGRVVVGLGVGIASTCVPLYIAEAAPAETRAALVSVNNLLITAGQFAAFVINSFLTTLPHPWRFMLGVCGIPAVLQLLGLQFLPESPRWLLSQGRVSEAESALKRLRSGEGAMQHQRELHALKIAQEQHVDEVSCSMVCSGPVRKQLALGMGLQMFQQFCGINTVMYFTPTILELAGYPTQTAVLMSLLPAGVNMAGSLVGVFLIERTGRRPLLLSSLLGVTIALMLLGFTFQYGTEHNVAVTLDQTPPNGELCNAPELKGLDYVGCNECILAGCGVCTADRIPMGEGILAPIKGAVDNTQLKSDGGGELAMCLTNTSASACTGTLIEGGIPKHLVWRGNACPNPYGLLSFFALIMYLAAFSPGLSPVPWAVNAEMYPQDVRGVGVGAATTTNWVSNFVVSQTFLEMTVQLGVANTFWLFSGVALLGLVIFGFALPETKGLSLEQVQDLFDPTRPSPSVVSATVREEAA